MPLDFSPAFARYEAIAAEADAVFAKVAAACPGMVTCGQGCSDCCHALFDLTFIEALYLNHRFNEAFPPGAARDVILERANTADREHYKLKRKAFRASQNGVSTAEILADIARERIRCPLLGDDDRCVLYASRPVTCRLYGVPQEVGGETHICGKAGFEPGGRYPTVKIEKLQDRLMELSQEVVAALPTKQPLMGDILVPVSLALITDYDDEYLGIITEDDLVQLPPAPPVPPAAPLGASCGSCGEQAGSSACASCAGGQTTWVLPGPDGAPGDDDK
ncbi:YkgJ family cysteine cluster protein [Solidesulfovibrio sp.]|uniref:YkgJ family cysteine cluster protein n=1 Tax=Solidesulfovibrio sp. TaxID=2910990 RepID=UPI002B1F515A|nr:YkgJ family cysteine cluster protein [Solidesulfovibrio sp.]MEA5087519.1 YkgJ family cysteine cluster protein [Solidesulfovibrio sp.]